MLSTLLLVIGVGAVCFGCAELIRLIGDTQHTSQKPPTHLSEADSAETESITVAETASVILSQDEAQAASETLTNSEPVNAPATETDAITSDSVFTESTSSEEEVPYVSPYADYFLEYPDMAAWLYIPDTNIDYPVMWTPGDETYYLYRHYDGTDNQNGSLLLDTDSSLSPLTTNLIVHGHDMRSGAMFGNLTDYADQTYCEQHKEMLLFTADCERRYEVIAVFYSQVYKKKDTVFKFYKFFQADTEEEFNDFYKNIQKLSLYDTGVTAEFGDRFITLSTCSSHTWNGRFVVVAKETADTNTQE